jgi:hypothetical protein
MDTPDGCHRNSLENSNICVFGNIQTLTPVYLPETDMRLSQRKQIGAITAPTLPFLPDKPGWSFLVHTALHWAVAIRGN